MRHRVWPALALAALAVPLSLSAQGHAAPSAQTTAAAAPCELHVWGAIKRFKPTSRFAAVAAPKGSYHADRSNPVANINALNPALRLQGVGDDAFAGFFGPDRPVRVVRHSANLDLKAAKKPRAPLSDRAAECHGDLIVSNLLDIEWPNGPPDPLSLGLLREALMAPAGMNMNVIFARYDTAGKLIERQRDNVHGAITLARREWAGEPVAAVKALDQSVEWAIRRFAYEQLGVEPPAP
ncbi:MAG: hypothetical protein AAF692_12470 [Pseudomonadota bacterium]